MTDCPHEVTEVVRIEHRSGAYSWLERCARVECQVQIGGWLTIDKAKDKALGSTAVVSYKADPDPPGEVCHHTGCDRTDTVSHHILPVATAGQAVADVYGTVPLCPVHHRGIHTALAGGRRREL